jgi:hypothetical protein
MKTAARVLVGTTRRLHDPVQRHVIDHDHSAHPSSPLRMYLCRLKSDTRRGVILWLEMQTTATVTNNQNVSRPLSENELGMLS